jgi:cyclopropane-fatty-acyl-phospholipid synthase
VLEIGCGWGEVGLRAARRFGCEWVGLTLSEEQLAHANSRAREEGLEGRVKFVLQDYRKVQVSGGGGVLADGQGRFDRIVSVEMLEAVGFEYLGEYYRALEDRLTPDGVAVVQVGLGVGWLTFGR